MYWCDAALGIIEAANLDGSSRLIFAHQNLTKPTNLELDVTHGYVIQLFTPLCTPTDACGFHWFQVLAVIRKYGSTMAWRQVKEVGSYSCAMSRH